MPRYALSRVDLPSALESDVIVFFLRWSPFVREGNVTERHLFTHAKYRGV